MALIARRSLVREVRAALVAFIDRFDPQTTCIYGLSDVSRELARIALDKGITITLVSHDVAESSTSEVPVLSLSKIPRAMRRVVVVCKPAKYSIIRDEIAACVKRNVAISHFYPAQLEPRERFHSSLTLQKAFRLIDRHSIISFDLFGTLILRNLFSDDSVYRILDRALTNRGIHGFFCARKLHEESFLFGRPEKMVLRAIYRAIARELPRSRVTLRSLPSEYELDRRFWSLSSYGLTLLRYAHSRGKKILITTDTFYTVNQLRSFLMRHLPPGVALFASSAFGKSKASGEMFALIKQRFRGRLVHFGDSRLADVVAPRHCRNSAVLLRNPTELSQYPDPVRAKALCKNVLDEYVVASLHRLYDPSSGTYVINSEEDLASTLFAPVLYNYLNWLMREIERNRINHLFFCAREGFFLQKLFTSFMGEKRPYSRSLRQSYLKCSRTIAQLAGIRREGDIIKVFARHRYEGTLHDLLRHRFQIPRAYLYDCPQEVMLDSRKDSLREHLAPYNEMILRRAGELRTNYRRYLHALAPDSTDRIAIVDQGVMGSAQKLVATILRNKIFGTYLCHFKSNPFKHKHFAGMLEGTSSSFLKVSHIFESVLTAPTGSYVWCGADLRFLTGKKFTNQRRFDFRRKVIRKVISDMSLFSCLERIEKPQKPFLINPEIVEVIFEGIASKKIAFAEPIAETLYFDNELVRPSREHRIR